MWLVIVIVGLLNVALVAAICTVYRALRRQSALLNEVQRDLARAADTAEARAGKPSEEDAP